MSDTKAEAAQITLGGKEFSLTTAVATPRYCKKYWAALAEMTRRMAACKGDPQAVEREIFSLGWGDEFERLIMTPLHGALEFSGHAITWDEFLDSQFSREEMLMAWPVIARLTGMFSMASGAAWR